MTQTLGFERGLKNVYHFRRRAMTEPRPDRADSACMLFGAPRGPLEAWERL